MHLETLFDNILACGHQLNHTLDHYQPDCWCNGYSNALSGIKEAINDYWYRDGMDGRETIAYYGLISANQASLRLAHDLNGLKDQFAQMVKEIRATSPAELNKYKHELVARHRDLANELAVRGLARLNLKQVTRAIPILEHNPAKVSFNWYKSGKSIQRISKQDALKRLLNFDVLNPHIRIQYEKLASLPDTETLALVQNLSPIMRTNILFGNGERTAFNVALPIFFPNDHGMPSFSVPEPTPPEKRQRKIRNDNQLEDEPIAPSIRVYRYRPGQAL